MGSFKTFVSQLFTWWGGQTMGTRLHTWRFGKAVGQDEFGNTYYQTADRRRRWVIYAGPAEPSTIPPGWHGWIHHRTDVAPPADAYRPHAWQKPHVPNLTGTAEAYRPHGSMMTPETRERVTGDYDPWTPG